MTASGALGGRILVGTDGSGRAELAVAQGARLASLIGAQLDLVYVIDSSNPGGEGERAAEGALQRSTEIAESFAVDSTGHITAGEPAEALVEEASEHDVRLICVGADTGLLDKPHKIGRVAAHVLQRAGTSVLVCRGGSEKFPRRLLCGIDGSEGSTMTAGAAARLAKLAAAELRVLHVVPVFKGGNEEWTIGPDDEVPEELLPGIRAARKHGIEPRLEMAMGRPESALVAVAGRDAVDLVVVGHRGLSGLSKFLMGSVSEHVTTHAPCSVLVVRPDEGGLGADG